MSIKTERTIAVLDLGSNSFHMVVARVDKQQNIHIIDRLKERVRLAAGLDENKMLTKQAMTHSLHYLQKLGERLSELEEASIRVVGTDTFRKAKNGHLFLQQAQEILNHPIEIISGLEEARLIYKGVSHDTPSLAQRILIDIGGGSTEIIIGRGPHPVDLASLHMGCVSWTHRYFPKGKMQRAKFIKATEAANQRLSPVVRRFRSLGWDQALGSSGTMKAIGNYMLENGLSDGRINRTGLELLRHECIAAGHTSKLNLSPFSESRSEVLAGGLSILIALFDTLRLEQLTPVKSALREGVLNQMVGRMFGEDIREQTVDAMTQRIRIDQSQATRVHQLSMQFFNNVEHSWDLGEADRKLLSWASRLHEVGVSIAFSGYHKHGAYLLKHADMPGFSQQEQSKLALLVRAHRGKIKFDDLLSILPSAGSTLFRLITLLRLATRLHRRRSPKPLPAIHVEAIGSKICLFLPKDYLHQRHLTHADLLDEKTHFEKLGYQLRLQEGQ